MFLCGVVAAIVRYLSLPCQNLSATPQGVACRRVRFRPEYYNLALDYFLHLLTSLRLETPRLHLRMVGVLVKQHEHGEKAVVHHVEVEGNEGDNMDGAEAYAPHVAVRVHVGDAEEGTCTVFPLADGGALVLDAVCMSMPLVNAVGKVDAPREEGGGRKAVEDDAMMWLGCTAH
jgi:hypothetical protein